MYHVLVEAITIFLVLTVTVVFAISSALLVKFIDFCFNEGNIFDWYYKILLDLEEKYPKLTKVFGLCPKCFGFWISFLLFIYYHNYFGIALIFFIPYISIAEYSIDKLFKLDDNKSILND
jgi:hypothetical protein